MRVVDTSAWIEWLSGSNLGHRISSELPANGDWIVPTIVQYELKRWAIRSGSNPQADTALAFSNKLIRSPVNSELAIRAAEIAVKHSLAMADAIIYATAVEAGADLLTCDAHFNLPGVVYLAKAPSP